jgi:hypothetical protein
LLEIATPINTLPPRHNFSAGLLDPEALPDGGPGTVCSDEVVVCVPGALVGCDFDAIV